MINDVIYLLDSENVNVKKLIKRIDEDLIDLKPKATLVIFCRENDNIKIQTMNKLHRYFDEILFESMKSIGKNAMDFYMVSSLSILATIHNNKEFKLISDDKGFAHSFEALKKYNKTNVYELLSQDRTISQTKSPKKTPAKVCEKKSIASLSRKEVRKRISSLVKIQFHDLHITDKNSYNLTNELYQALFQSTGEINKRISIISRRYKLSPVSLTPIISELTDIKLID